MRSFVFFVSRLLAAFWTSGFRISLFQELLPRQYSSRDLNLNFACQAIDVSVSVKTRLVASPSGSAGPARADRGKHLPEDDDDATFSAALTRLAAAHRLYDDLDIVAAGNQASPVAGYVAQVRPKSSEYDKLVADKDASGPVSPGSADVLLSERQQYALQYRFVHEVLNSAAGAVKASEKEKLRAFVDIASSFPQYRGALAGVGTHGLDDEIAITSGGGKQVVGEEDDEARQLNRLQSGSIGNSVWVAGEYVPEGKVFEEKPLVSIEVRDVDDDEEESEDDEDVASTRQARKSQPRPEVHVVFDAAAKEQVKTVLDILAQRSRVKLLAIAHPASTVVNAALRVLYHGTTTSKAAKSSYNKFSQTKRAIFLRTFLQDLLNAKAWWAAVERSKNKREDDVVKTKNFLKTAMIDHVLKKGKLWKQLKQAAKGVAAEIEQQAGAEKEDENSAAAEKEVLRGAGFSKLPVLFCHGLVYEGFSSSPAAAAGSMMSVRTLLTSVPDAERPRGTSSKISTYHPLLHSHLDGLALATAGTGGATVVAFEDEEKEHGVASYVDSLADGGTGGGTQHSSSDEGARKLVYVVGKDTENWFSYLQSALAAEGSREDPAKNIAEHFPDVEHFLAEKLQANSRTGSASWTASRTPSNSTATALRGAGRFVVCNGAVSPLGDHDIASTSVVPPQQNMINATSDEHSFPFSCVPRVPEIVADRPKWEAAAVKHLLGRCALRIGSSKAGDPDSTDVVAALDPLDPAAPIVGRALLMLHEEFSLSVLLAFNLRVKPDKGRNFDYSATAVHKPDLRHWTRVSVEGEKLEFKDIRLKTQTNLLLYLEVVPPDPVAWEIRLVNGTGDLDNLRADEGTMLDVAYAAEYEITGVRYQVKASLPRRAPAELAELITGESKKRDEGPMCLPLPEQAGGEAAPGGQRQRLALPQQLPDAGSGMQRQMLYTITLPTDEAEARKRGLSTTANLPRLLAGPNSPSSPGTTTATAQLSLFPPPTTVKRSQLVPCPGRAEMRTELDWKLKFYVLRDFLSARFDVKEIEKKLPNVEIELLATPAWPDYLREGGHANGDKIGIRQDKQRLIWAYKVLFLDVLFFQKTNRVVFIDADQIVQKSLVSLWQTELHPAAVWAFVPFCYGGEKNDKTLGHRFWDRGYWNDLMTNPSRPGSAFEQITEFSGLPKEEEDEQEDEGETDEINSAAGGGSTSTASKRDGGERGAVAATAIRGTYKSLGRDENSLSNLDQDLPNYLHGTDQLSIQSLDQSWLWCETWCAAEGLEKARTVDLCQNPLTKEHKLDQARRIGGTTWEEYDNFWTGGSLSGESDFAGLVKKKQNEASALQMNPYPGEFAQLMAKCQKWAALVAADDAGGSTADNTPASSTSLEHQCVDIKSVGTLAAGLDGRLFDLIKAVERWLDLDRFAGDVACARPKTTALDLSAGSCSSGPAIPVLMQTFWRNRVQFYCAEVDVHGRGGSSDVSLRKRLDALLGQAASQLLVLGRYADENTTGGEDQVTLPILDGDVVQVIAHHEGGRPHHRQITGVVRASEAFPSSVLRPFGESSVVLPPHEKLDGEMLAKILIVRPKYLPAFVGRAGAGMGMILAQRPFSAAQILYTLDTYLKTVSSPPRALENEVDEETTEPDENDDGETGEGGDLMAANTGNKRDDTEPHFMPDARARTAATDFEDYANALLHEKSCYPVPVDSAGAAHIMAQLDAARQLSYNMRVPEAPDAEVRCGTTAQRAIPVEIVDQRGGGRRFRSVPAESLRLLERGEPAPHVAELMRQYRKMRGASVGNIGDDELRDAIELHEYAAALRCRSCLTRAGGLGEGVSLLDLTDAGRALNVARRFVATEEGSSCCLVTAVGLLTQAQSVAPFLWQDVLRIADEVLCPGGVLLQYDTDEWGGFADRTIMESYVKSEGLALKLLERSEPVDYGSGPGGRMFILIWNKVEGTNGGMRGREQLKEQNTATAHAGGA
eukprot:g3074.t1